MTVRHWFACVVVAGSVALAGCGGSSSNSAPKSAGAQLPADDKALAEAQKVCPVTGEPLGSMGVPVKVTLKGQAVFLCCKGCVGKAEKDPDAVLKKVKQPGPPKG